MRSCRKLVQGKRLHAGFVIAIARRHRWSGSSTGARRWATRCAPWATIRKAARFAGIPVNRVLAKTALLSGGLAGLAGWSEVAGLKGNLTLDLSPGFGYTGIVVAMLALLHPLGVVAAAIFVAGVFVGADAMSRSAGVPSYIAHVMVATVAALHGDRHHVHPLPCTLDLKMEAIEILFTASLWAAAIRIASPLIFATLGELICERAGVLNLGIEGIMTAGAFAGWLAVYHGSRPVVRRGGGGNRRRNASAFCMRC